MDRELARKRPATIVQVEPEQTRTLASARVRTIRNANRTVVAAEAARLWRAGLINREYRLARQGDVWIAVVDLKPPQTWFQRNRKKLAFWTGGSLAFLGATALILRAIAQALAALVGPAIAVGGASLLVVVLVTVMGLGTGVTIIQKVTIK